MQVIHANKLFFKVALTTFSSLLFLLPVNGVTSALTYQSSTDVEFTLNPTLNVTLSSSDLTIDNLVPGSSSDSNVITASVSTNAGYGYYLSATAGTKTGNTDLTNGSSNTKFTNLSSTATTLNDIPADHWGYSYSQDDGTTWVSGNADATTSGYNGLPLDNDDSGATGVMLLRTDSFSNAGSVKFKIGAKASPSQASGTYTNTVNFYAVANPEPQLGPEPCEPRKICYNVNSLTQTEGTMGRQSAPADGNSVTLLASNFSRTGYGFAGWSDTYDYTGTLYGPQETITTPTGTATNGLSLYAIWIKSAGSMQSDATSICSGLTAATPSTTKTLNSVSALTDQRDGDTYAIAKLADDNCWMIENLRLDAENTRGDTNRLLSQGYGTSTTYGDFIGLADAESIGFSETYTANSLYYSGTQSGTATIDIGASNYPAYRMPRYNNLNTTNRASNPISNSFVADGTTGGMYSYGNYYTWHAAMADTAYYSSGDRDTTSICPLDWKIPLGKTSTGNLEQGVSDAANRVGGFSYLDRKMGGTGANQSTTSSRWRRFPVNLLFSGSFSGSSSYFRGDQGSYLSSTVYDRYNSYGMRLNDSDIVYPGTATRSLPDGYSIRCIVGS